MGKLTNRQQMFINEYLQCWNATEAARRAGYTGNDNVLGVTGFDLLRNPKIMPVIEERMRESVMKAEEALLRLSQQARVTMADFIDADTQTINLAKAEKANKLHLIKKFTQQTGKGGVRVSIELYDAQHALEVLAKHHGLLVERVSVDDWRSEAIRLIQRGELPYEALVEAFDDTLAAELFRAAGISVQVRASESP